MRDKALLKVKLANVKSGVPFNEEINPDPKISSVKDNPPSKSQLMFSPSDVCHTKSWFALSHKIFMLIFIIVSLSSFDFPPREHFEGVWSTFDVSRASRELEALISSVGEIYNAPPYTVSHIIQVPAGVGIFASNVCN